MNYTLCRYTPHQAGKLAAFVLPIAGRTYARWVDPVSARAWALSEHGVDAWGARLGDTATHVLAYERPDASVAACAFVRITDTTAHFGGLYVQDAGCGLGTLLYTERLRISRESGVHTAVMLIRATNGPARALAEKAGFTAAGEDPCSQLSSVPRMRYSMQLETPALVPA